MTPAKTIKLECRWCMGGTRGMNCYSEVCKLNDKSLTPLKRIKFHCLDCVESKGEVKNCSGKLLFEDRLCYLHPYRLGKNPRLKGLGNPENFKKSSTNDMVLASGN